LTSRAKKMIESMLNLALAIFFLVSALGIGILIGLTVKYMLR
jgi:hypothetical protein